MSYREESVAELIKRFEAKIEETGSFGKTKEDKLILQELAYRAENSTKAQEKTLAHQALLKMVPDSSISVCYNKMPLNELFKIFKDSVATSITSMTPDARDIQKILIRRGDAKILLEMFKLNNKELMYKEIYFALAARGDAGTSTEFNEHIRRYDPMFMDPDLVLPRKMYFINEILNYENDYVLHRIDVMAKNGYKFNAHSKSWIKKENSAMMINPVAYAESLFKTQCSTPHYNEVVKNSTAAAILNGNGRTLHWLLQIPQAMPVVQAYINKGHGQKIKADFITYFSNPNVTKEDSLELTARVMASNNENAIYLLAELEDLDPQSQMASIEVLKKIGTPLHLQSLLIEAKNYDVIKQGINNTFDLKVNRNDINALLHYDDIETNFAQQRLALTKLFGSKDVKNYSALLSKGYHGCGYQVLINELLATKNSTLIKQACTDYIAREDIKKQAQKMKDPAILQMLNISGSSLSKRK